MSLSFHTSSVPMSRLTLCRKVPSAWTVVYSSGHLGMLRSSNFTAKFSQRLRFSTSPYSRERTLSAPHIRFEIQRTKEAEAMLVQSSDIHFCEERTPSLTNITYLLSSYMDNVKALDKMVADLSWDLEKYNFLTSQQLMWWISDEYVRRRMLKDVHRNLLEARYAATMEGNYMSRREARSKVTIGAPFDDATDRLRWIFLSLERQEKHSPDSLLVQAIYASEPKDSRRYGTLSVIPHLKSCSRQLFDDSTEIKLHHRNMDLFSRELCYIIDPFWKNLHSLRGVTRKTRELINQSFLQGSYGRKRSRSQRECDIEGQIAASRASLTISGIHLGACILEYQTLVEERLARYQEIIKQNPDELPIIKAQMLSIGEISPLDPGYVSRVNQHIDLAFYNLRRMKKYLRALSHYLAQSDNPSIPFRRRKPVDHFLENVTKYQSIPAFLKNTFPSQSSFSKLASPKSKQRRGSPKAKQKRGSPKAKQKRGSPKSK